MTDFTESGTEKSADHEAPSAPFWLLASMIIAKHIDIALTVAGANQLKEKAPELYSKHVHGLQCTITVTGVTRAHMHTCHIASASAWLGRAEEGREIRIVWSPMRSRSGARGRGACARRCPQPGGQSIPACMCPDFGSSRLTLTGTISRRILAPRCAVYPRRTCSFQKIAMRIPGHAASRLALRMRPSTFVLLGCEKPLAKLLLGTVD